ncbi:MAG: porin family protein [Duncaniella sp.]|nr:porin family protein [Duncaniella sp.]
MKKFLALAAAAVIALGASAQNWYLGGSVVVGQEKVDGEKTTQINFMPEVGYNLSETLAIGTTVGVDYVKFDEVKSTLVNFNPYVRYTFLRAGIASFFCDGGVDLGFGKTKVADYSSDTAVTYGIGFKPGVALTVSEKFGFVAHVGFLGYKGANDAAKEAGKPEVYGLSLNGNNLSIGFYYNF